MEAAIKKSRVRSSDYVHSHITKIPGVCGGKAIIDGKRIRVMDIVYLHKWGYPPEKMLDVYDTINLAQVYAALSYYYEHPEEIETQMKEDEKWGARYEREKAKYLKKGVSSSTSR